MSFGLFYACVSFWKELPVVTFLFLFLENNDVIIFDLIFINFLLVWRRRTPIFSLCVKEGYLFPITEIGVSTCRLYYFFCKTQPASWFFYDAHFEAYSKSFFGFSHVSLEPSQSVRPALKSYFIFKSAVFPKCRCLMGWLPVSCSVGRDGAVRYGVRTNCVAYFVSSLLWV